jgi:hypothetical protein
MDCYCQAATTNHNDMAGWRAHVLLMLIVALLGHCKAQYMHKKLLLHSNNRSATRPLSDCASLLPLHHFWSCCAMAVVVFIQQ